MEHLVGDQGGRAKLREVTVALLDDFNGGEDLRDGGGGLSAGGRAKGQVRAQPDAHLALDADREEIPEGGREAIPVQAGGGTKPAAG